MSDIIELSPAIAEVISAAADGANNYTFVLIEAADTDPPERKRLLAAELDEVMDLVELGILMDISSMFIQQITHCRDANGFGYVVLQLTRVGVTMFSNSKDRKTH